MKILFDIEFGLLIFFGKVDFFLHIKQKSDIIYNDLIFFNIIFKNFGNSDDGAKV
jgi:hypothetical protein